MNRVSRPHDGNSSLSHLRISRGDGILDTMSDEPSLRCWSLDGEWLFDGSCLVCGDHRSAVFEYDWWKRWTFARFIAPDVFAAAFETSQPYSEGGSYGDRLGGVLVHQRQGMDWPLVALDHDYRAHDESFVPDAVAWHPRGLLAWLHKGELYAYLLRRRPTDYDINSPSDSYDEDNLALELNCFGPWHTLRVARDGQQLVAIGDHEREVFDLRIPDTNTAT